jgi:hypothetical protein
LISWHLVAISEHERQVKIIKDQKEQFQRLEARLQRQEHEFDLIRREANTFRIENAQLRAEIASLQNSLGIAHHAPGNNPPQPNGYGMQPPLEQQQQQLPPLRNLQGPESMNGVQYQHDPRNDNFRRLVDFEARILFMSFNKYSSQVSAILFYVCGSVSSPYFPPYGNLGSDAAVNNDLNVYTAALLRYYNLPGTHLLEALVMLEFIRYLCYYKAAF